MVRAPLKFPALRPGAPASRREVDSSLSAEEVTALWQSVLSSAPEATASAVDVPGLLRST